MFAGINLAIDKGSRVVILGYNGAGKTTTLRLLAHIEDPDTGVVEYGHGCKVGYFAQEHDTLDLKRHRVGEPAARGAGTGQHAGPFDPGLVPVLRRRRVQAGRRALRRREDATGARHAGDQPRQTWLLLDEPTNNLDPASREEILKAIAKYEGAIVLVTHDEGAVKALNPERVLLMPDGDEDLWNDEYLDLVAEE